MKSHEPRLTVFETVSNAKNALDQHKTTVQSRTSAAANSPSAPTGNLSDMAEELSHMQTGTCRGASFARQKSISPGPPRNSGLGHTI